MQYRNNRSGGSSGDAEGAWQPGRSVHRDDRDNCAYLKVWDDSPKLNANRNDNANPNYGSVQFRR
ncbi:hypothetical protein HYS28_02060 [Candidatus Uhrbacteria bacterium]|nr:hypothetical protein [Candidatus Uhrbacteria bacterium]